MTHHTSSIWTYSFIVCARSTISWQAFPARLWFLHAVSKIACLTQAFLSRVLTPPPSSSSSIQQTLSNLSRASTDVSVQHRKFLHQMLPVGTWQRIESGEKRREEEKQKACECRDESSEREAQAASKRHSSDVNMWPDVILCHYKQLKKNRYIPARAY